MNNDTIQSKLKARRRAMNLTMQSSTLSVTNNEDTEVDDDEIVTIPDTTEEETEIEAISQLQEKLESRHDAIRKKLQTSEIQTISTDPVKHKRNLLGTELDMPTTSVDSSQELTRDSISAFERQTSSTRMSLRSRLEAKLQAAKEKRGLSPLGDESRMRMRRLKERISFPSRFDSPQYLLGRPDLEIERSLEQKITAKLNWKKVYEKAREHSGLFGDAECLDFFTKQYEEVADDQQPHPIVEQILETVAEEEITPGEEAPAEPIEPIEETEADEEEKKILVEDLVSQEMDWNLCNITAAEYISYRSRIQTDQLISFVPSMLDAPAERKVLDSAQPLYLEEEGFYVGEPPEVQRRNHNILENRIISSMKEGTSWFGVDGRVKLLPNPVRSTCTKPWMSSLEDFDASIETVYVKAFESDVNEKYLKGSEEHELQVDVGTIIFHHHPMMSREHVIASKISELYDAYIQHRHKNYAVFYHEKLQALRLAVEVMKKNAGNEEIEEVSALATMELRVQDFVSEIRRTCHQRDLAEMYERDLMRQIISEWNEIKSLRAAQRYHNTSVKMTIKKQEVNQEADREEWMKEIDIQLRECFEEYQYTTQYPYRKLVTEYQKNLQIWKQKKIKLKNQRKEQLNDQSETVADETENLLVGVNPKPLKPDAPKKFDENLVREELVNKALYHRRNPVEPKISLEVTYTGSITPNSQVPAGELSRRRALQKSELLAKILFNGKEACRTERKSVTTDFKIHFGQIFKIRISQWPESLKVQVYEPGLLNDSFLTEINLMIPDGSINSSNAQMFPVNFTSNKAVNYGHEGVGSSVPFTLYADPAPPLSINTCGQIIMSVSWSLSDQGRILAPKLLTQQGIGTLEEIEKMQKKEMTSEILGSLNLQDPDAAVLWSQEGKLDPNDPSNSGVLSYINMKEGYMPSMDFFQLDQLQEEFSFVSSEELERARRFRLLEYRTKEVVEFRNLRLVPANEHEILDSAFTVYERRKKEKDSLAEMGEKKVVTGTLSAHRLEVLRFRQRVRESVLQRFFSARHHHTLQDMVHEDQVPDIGTLGVSLLKMTEPRRPLKPVRSERKKATAQNLTEGSVTISVTVVRAYNLPVRDKVVVSSVQDTLSRAVLGTASQQLHGEGEEFKLSPFVSVSFQGLVKATNVAQGPSPSWNEQLELPFSAKNNDYTPESLQTVDDTLFINIFDRVVQHANIDTRDQNEIGESSGVAAGVVSHRIQNHWLGSLRIPFSTIYQRGKIDGTFKLDVPLVMLGYKTELSQQTSSSDPYAQMESQFLQPVEGSYLNVFITMEPELGRPEPIQQKFETQEDEQLITNSIRFNEECRKKFPNRRVKTTVIDIKGESVFLTRYVKPLQPPAELLEGTNSNSLVSAEKLARFVSLIPFVSDNVIYAGKCDLWSTCDQFLNMLCGDEEEHSILLLNYFLYIGKQAYLVLGNAVPEGETAYVLTLEQSQEYLLWNASNGQHYKTSNSLCPLQNIYALVNQNNIWFNMQDHDIPSRVNFNVANTRAWKAFFKSPTTELMSVQPDSLVYPQTDLAYVQNLEERIERSLRDSLMKLRPRHVTRWNRSCSSALQQILRELENDRWRHSTVSEVSPNPSRMSLLRGDHTTILSRLIGDARFVGFPMDMAFTDIDTVIQAVRSTEVHKIQDNDIEFAVAVYVHPYPCSVLCVWVYVAAVNSTRAI